MKLAPKIWLSLSVLLAGYAVSVTVDYLLNRRVVERTAYVWDCAYPVSIQAEGIVIAHENLWSLYRDAVLMGDADRIEQAEELASRTAADIQALAVHKDIPQSFSDNAGTTSDDLRTVAREAGETYRALIQADDEPSVELQEMVGTLAIRRRELTRALASLSANASEDLKTQLETIRRSSEMQSHVNITVFLLVLLVTLPLVSVAIRRVILAPFRQILQTARTGETLDPSTLPSDEIGELACAFSDLHEQQKRAEVELRKERDRAQRYLDVAGVMFLAIDSDGIVTLVNRKGCEILGYPVEEIVGKNWFDHFLTPKVRESILAVSHSLLEGDVGLTEYYENTVLTRSGEERLIAWHNVPLRDELGNVTGHLSSGQDVTDQRSMETQLRQSQKLESIGTLAGGVAHEINNPINGIMNYAQLILDKLGPNHEVSMFATEIGNETKRVARIVKGLLSFSRRDTQTRSEARMGDIVEAILSLIRSVLQHDQVALDVDIPEDLPTITCRSQQIQQVIMNLLTNARDALNEKYPGHDEDKRISISAREMEMSLINGHSSLGEYDPTLQKPRKASQCLMTNDVPAGHNDAPKAQTDANRRVSAIRLTVEDHGSGIPKHVREHLFDPFYTSKRPGKGTGLGLAISHTIVKDHGGDLSVESKVGEWTRFYVDLPVGGSDA